MTLCHLLRIFLCFGLLLEGSLVMANKNFTQLTEKYYDKTCPKAFSIVTNVIKKALRNDRRILSSLLRLHFHDCFVTGCDASILLDNSTTFVSEKNGLINLKSARGFNVIDEIKDELEKACPGTVSCADILAIASQVSVHLAGGPAWGVPLGRRDSRTANLTEANSFIRAFIGGLDDLEVGFASKGLNGSDLVALSGAHTMGNSRCRFFSSRLYPVNGTGPDRTLDPHFAQSLRSLCPPNDTKGDALADLDHVTRYNFDNQYFKNLLELKGLLRTDQVLYSTPGADTAATVTKFAGNQAAFFSHFGESMRKMGNIRTLTGADGEVRRNCRKVNG